MMPSYRVSWTIATVLEADGREGAVVLFEDIVRDNLRLGLSGECTVKEIRLYCPICGDPLPAPGHYTHCYDYDKEDAWYPTTEVRCPTLGSDGPWVVTQLIPCGQDGKQLVGGMFKT